MKRLIVLIVLLVGLGLQEQINAAALSRTGSVATNPSLWTRGLNAFSAARQRVSGWIYGLKQDQNNIFINTSPQGTKMRQYSISHGGFSKKPLSDLILPEGYEREGGEVVEENKYDDYTSKYLDTIPGLELLPESTTPKEEYLFLRKKRGYQGPGPAKIYLYQSFKDPSDAMRQTFEKPEE